MWMKPLHLIVLQKKYNIILNIISQQEYTITSYNPNYPASWTNSSINGSTITDGSNATTAAIDNDNITGTEISVTVVYDATTADEGVKVYVLRDVDGTNYEAVVDGPWSFMMPYTINTTHRRTFTVLGNNTSKFKVEVTNDSGASVTATVRYKQFTIDQTQ